MIAATATAPRMKHLYEQFTLKANKSDEQAWMIGRIVLVIGVFAGTYWFMRGTSAEFVLYGCGIAVLVYNAVLYLMIRRGKAKGAFSLGFAFDNIAMLIGWWFCVSALAGEKQTNDLYLVLAPKLIIGVARLGWKTGLIYMAAWLSWMGATHYYHYGPGSYDVAQLPLRLAFMGAGSVVAGRLVARLDNEKKQAVNLRHESDSIAEIGRLAGSTMELRAVFQPIAKIIQKLIPYTGISVVEIDQEQAGFTVVAKAGRELGIWDGATDHPMTLALMADMSERNEPVILDHSASRLLLTAISTTDNLVIDSVRSMILVPAMANDVLVAVLVAWSDRVGAFGDKEVSVMRRVGSHLSGAVANARLYQRSVELNKVQEVSEAKSALLSAVSHELKTPLTSMVAFTDILLRNRTGNLNEKQLRHLTVLRRNEDALTGLVDDLLDASRIERGRLELDIQPVDMREMVDDVVESLSPIINERAQQIYVDVDDCLEIVHADRRRLMQVIRNLVTNASKYSHADSRIELSASLQSNEVSILVKDEGIGMSEEDQRHLFSPFFRSNNKEAHRQPGTGLGLVITKGIVEAHGGRIELTSAPNMGTAVCVVVPAVADSPPQLRAA